MSNEHAHPIFKSILDGFERGYSIHDPCRELARAFPKATREGRRAIAKATPPPAIYDGGEDYASGGDNADSVREMYRDEQDGELTVVDDDDDFGTSPSSEERQ